MLNRSQDIFENLKERGIDVHFPGHHQGECDAPYVVVKYTGSSQISTYSSTQATYNLIVYVPVLQYAMFETFIDEVKNKMKPMEPMIMPTHFISDPFYDEQVKAHSVSIQYRNARKI